MKKGGGPWWLGPALVSLPAVTTLLCAATGAAIRLGRAFVGGGVAAAGAYGSERVGMGRADAADSPEKMSRSDELGKMAQPCQNGKPSATPVIVGSLQPGVAGVTTGIELLGRVIRPMGQVVTALGTEF